MQLVLTDDQSLLEQTARDFVAAKSPLGRLRRLRDAADPLGYDRALYAEMGALGWTAIPFTEDQGGLGLGMADLVIVTEALGHALVPEPLAASVVFAGALVAAAGSEAQQSALLPGIVDGSRVAAVALDEPPGRFDPARIATRAERTAGGWRLTGTKAPVLGGFGADVLIVVARTAGAERDRDGLTLFVVDGLERPGLGVERQWRIDSQNAALVTLDGLELSSDAVLGPEGGAAPLVEAALDRATVALAGEMLGGMTEALDRTLDYLKERVQFGVVIGTFQALKHRAARMFIERELTRSAVMAAARALDDGPAAKASVLVSAAKARASDAYVLIANEAVQMFGGIGMTDEHDIGFYLKRARVAQATFGDAAYHRDRFARLNGF